MTYDVIARNYRRGLWNRAMLEECVKRGVLTRAQADELAGGDE